MKCLGSLLLHLERRQKWIAKSKCYDLGSLTCVSQEEVGWRLTAYFRSRDPPHRTRSFERTALLPMVVLLTSMFFLHPAL